MEEFAPKPLGSREPWSYTVRASELLEDATSAVDMGTGGGEVFEQLCAAYRERAVATEPWHANAQVAAARLRPLGIDVVRCHSLALPFRPQVFDLVLNRHEELDPEEVARVVAAGGSLLTQQIGRTWWQELRESFPRMRDFGDVLRRYEGGLRASGLTIVQARTHDWKAAYRGLGDVVFILCVAPWTIPDFDPLGRDLPALLDAEERLSTADGIALTESLFLIEARKEA
ncbi:MAG: methyltransferase domain-containing protein [Methanobacteriota archaeon]